MLCCHTMLHPKPKEMGRNVQNCVSKSRELYEQTTQAGKLLEDQLPGAPESLPLDYARVGVASLTDGR